MTENPADQDQPPEQPASKPEQPTTPPAAKKKLSLEISDVSEVLERKISP